MKKEKTTKIIMLTILSIIAILIIATSIITNMNIAITISVSLLSIVAIGITISTLFENKEKENLEQTKITAKTDEIIEIQEPIQEVKQEVKQEALQTTKKETTQENGVTVETKEKLKKFLFDKINLWLSILGVVFSLVGFSFIIVLCVISSREVTLNKKYSLDLGKAFEDYISLSMEFSDKSSGVLIVKGYESDGAYGEEPFTYRVDDGALYIKFNGDDYWSKGTATPYKITIKDETSNMSVVLTCTSAKNTKTLSIVLIPVGLTIGVALFIICAIRVKKNKKEQTMQVEQEANKTEQTNFVEDESKNSTASMEEELNSIKQMLDSGVITEQEFDTIRKSIIEKYFKIN